MFIRIDGTTINTEHIMRIEENADGACYVYQHPDESPLVLNKEQYVRFVAALQRSGLHREG